MTKDSLILRIIAYKIGALSLEGLLNDIDVYGAKNFLWKDVEIEKFRKCPRCGIVPAKGAGCLNYTDCPYRVSTST